jgi:hypothetical protein
MSCNRCGDCLYSSSSTATLEVIITSSGLPEECRQDSENLFSDLPYKSPGVWERNIEGLGSIRVQSKCVSGVWLWSAPARAIGTGKPIPPNCSKAGVETPSEPTRNDCGGFERVLVTTYPDGGWMRTHVKMTVNNNSECE